MRITPPGEWPYWQCEPVFRVCFYEAAPPPGTSYAETRYDVAEADVLDVLDWAQRQSGEERLFTISVLFHDAHQEACNPGYGWGEIPILGVSPNTSGVRDEVTALRIKETQRRMNARRQRPVVIPEV